MTQGPLSVYKAFVQANLPSGMTASEEYFFVNDKRFTNYVAAKWYLDYIFKFGFSSSTPIQDLINTLLVDAAQLIAHPLEYGSMFQDRAGTVPVTASGQVLGYCLDSGPGGYHATAISDAARGVFRDIDGIRYIEYNGVNTAYATPAMPAPLVDKAQVFGGVRKLSDASSGSFVNLGRSVDNGHFEILAPLTAGTYRFAAKGTLEKLATGSDFPAPVTSVLTAFADISGDNTVLRIDGTQVGQSLGDLGTGTFNPSGNYPIGYGSRAGTSVFFNGRSYATLGPITRFSAANATAAQIEATEAYYTARVV